jgi:hypothetical protein
MPSNLCHDVRPYREERFLDCDKEALSMKYLLFSASLIMAAASTLAAQDEPNAFRRFDINLNVVSFARIEGVNARGAQFEFVGRFNSAVGIVGNIAGHRKNGTMTDLYAYRVGPRLYIRSGTRVTTFGHFLIGGGQIENSTVSGVVTTTQSVNGFSMAMGGGLDVAVKPWLAIRVGELDYDYFRFQGVTLDGFRVGGGVVFRFGK